MRVPRPEGVAAYSGQGGIDPPAPEHVVDFTAQGPEQALAMAAASELACDRGGAWSVITSKGPGVKQTVFQLHLHLVPREAGDELALPRSPQPVPAGLDDL
ncbi:Diadenosine tetraphosphate (Ap4A) hydrolase [Promicromonospora umidemergens]|uniref:HIT domain-containing protein n=1 Tax=Promicromonospora umidemergens TaxID=629679 RepID=A0ABP8XIN3_9MICO|nr:Diadenosine tetraphosphate (Ap4A) hydrolase [Promicromonospora umidemergens]